MPRNAVKKRLIHRIFAANKHNNLRKRTSKVYLRLYELTFFDKKTCCFRQKDIKDTILLHAVIITL